MKCPILSPHQSHGTKQALTSTCTDEQVPLVRSIFGMYLYVQNASVPTNWCTPFQGTSFQGTFGSWQTRLPSAEWFIVMVCGQAVS